MPANSLHDLPRINERVARLMKEYANVATRHILSNT
jgi:hypothetical protein